MNDELIRKIQKLLSLATSDNENEARLATQRANELLLKHNLTMQSVKDRKFDYEGKERFIGYSYKEQHRSISNLLEEFFFVRILIHSQIDREKSLNKLRWLYKKSIQIIGTKENSQIASYVFDFLNEAYPKLWAQYQKKTKCDKSKKNSYFKGLTYGIADNLNKTKWKVEKETGLVLIKDAQLEEHIKKQSSGSYRGNKCNIDKNAVYQGYKDGLEVVLNKPIESKSDANKVLSLNEPK